MVSEIDIAILAANARVAAIRWDILPWSVVLDLDVYLTEADSKPMHRGWLIFDGVGDMFLPFHESRLPLGFWIDGVSSERMSDGRVQYSIRAQLPSFVGGEGATFKAPQLVRFEANRAFGLISEESAYPNEYGFLDFETRKSLAGNEEFRRFLNEK